MSSLVYGPDFYTQNLRKINPITKYPSIHTYHEMGERGRLVEKNTVGFHEDVWVTEKIDGTNARVIVFPKVVIADDFPRKRLCPTLIGSREELLHAVGDLIWNPAQGIVQTLRHDAVGVLETMEGLADALQTTEIPGQRTFVTPFERVFVFYGEVYGGRTTAAAKNYGPSDKTGFRLFDVAVFPLGQLDQLIGLELEKIASWRDEGRCTPFLTMDFRSWAETAADRGLKFVPLVAYLKHDIGRDVLPYTIPEIRSVMNVLPRVTQASLDNHETKGLVEGYVVRNHDRSKIVKLRFEDYDRTLGHGRVK
jgi:hypothetical protein